MTDGRIRLLLLVVAILTAFWAVTDGLSTALAFVMIVFLLACALARAKDAARRAGK